jgi:hypothetical protein
MRDPSTTHGRAITSFYVARRQCVNIKISIKFWSNEIDRGTQLFWKKICPSTTLSDRNITEIGLGSNTDPRSSRWNWSEWNTRVYISVIGVEVYGCFWSHSETPQSVGLLRTSDRPVAETSTWQHTTFKRENIHAPVGIRNRNPTGNETAHRALATQKKLAYLGFECLDHPPYSLDLVPSDYHLFPGLKKTSERKGGWAKDLSTPRYCLFVTSGPGAKVPGCTAAIRLIVRPVF